MWDFYIERCVLIITHAFQEICGNFYFERCVLIITRVKENGGIFKLIMCFNNYTCFSGKMVEITN